MVSYPIRRIRTVRTLSQGRTLVEIEILGGFVKAVDPATRKVTKRRQRFVLSASGETLMIYRGGGE